MAKEDYVANSQTAEVTYCGDVVAKYNTTTGEVDEYFLDGSKRKRWIKEAIKEAPEFAEARSMEDITRQELEDVRYRNVDFYKVFPSAPQPRENKVGYDHPEIYQWIQKNYPEASEVIYPNGPWSAKEAGMVGNKTITGAGTRIA